MKRMFIFMDLRGESLSSQSTIPAKIQKGSLRPVGVSEETSRGGVFGIGCMWFWDPGIGWCCFQRFGSLRLNLSACNFYHLEWQVNKNLGRKFFRIFTRSPDSWTSRKYGLSCGKLHMFSVILDAIGVLILEALSAAATLQTPCQAALIAAYVHHSPSLTDRVGKPFQVQEKQISSGLKKTCSRWWNFKYFCYFHPYLGEDDLQLDEYVFKWAETTNLCCLNGNCYIICLSNEFTTVENVPSIL